MRSNPNAASGPRMAAVRRNVSLPASTGRTSAERPFGLLLPVPHARHLHRNAFGTDADATRVAAPADVTPAMRLLPRVALPG